MKIATHREQMEQNIHLYKYRCSNNNNRIFRAWEFVVKSKTDSQFCKENKKHFTSIHRNVPNHLYTKIIFHIFSRFSKMEIWCFSATSCHCYHLAVLFVADALAAYTLAKQRHVSHFFFFFFLCFFSFFSVVSIR